MQECKPLHLCVSLVPDAVLSPMEPQNRTELPAKFGPSRSPQSPPRVGVETDTIDEAESRVETRENTGSKTEESDGGSVVHGPASAQEATPAGQPAERSASDDVQPTPWVLDICLVRVSMLLCYANSTYHILVQVGLGCTTCSLLVSPSYSISVCKGMSPIYILSFRWLPRVQRFCDALRHTTKTTDL